MTDKIEIAMWFARMGLPVFPLSPKSKEPIKGSRGVYDATTNLDQIATWSTQYPDCNWAMACGEKSGIVVVDVDPKNDGLVSMEKAKQDYGRLPTGPTVQTASGGFHIYFTMPLSPPLKNKPILRGVDMRTTGGYVVIPGSTVVYEDGTTGSYKWLKTMDDYDLPDLPGWVIEEVTSGDNFTFDETGKIGKGQRNLFILSLGGSMRRRSFGREAIHRALHAENQARCDPPMDEHEVDRIVENIMGYAPEEETLVKFIKGEDSSELLDKDVRADALLSEASIIGYLLSENLDQNFLATIMTSLQPAKFMDETNRSIFRCVMDLWSDKVTLTVDNIGEALRSNGLYDKIDVHQYAARSKTILYEGDIAFHTKRILEAWLLRESMTAFVYGQQATAKGDRRAQDVVSDVSGRLLRLLDGGTENRVKTTKESTRLVRKLIKDAELGLMNLNEPTGWDYLDEKIIGFPKAEITLVAGRPSQGKTAFTLQLAYSMGRNWMKTGEKHGVLFFSAEMTAQQLMLRNLARETEIDSKTIREGRLSQNQKRIIDAKLDEIDETLEMFIDETSNPSGQYMMAKALALNSQVPIKLIVFDFLELVGLDDETKALSTNKVLRLEEALRKLKTIAKTLNIPVIILSQLSREVESRATTTNPPIPRLSDLRWTGMAEQLANLIMMVYWPWFFENAGIPFPEEQDRNHYEIHVVKNRDGDVGKIPLYWQPEFGKYSAPTERFEPGKSTNIIPENVDPFAELWGEDED